MPEARQKLIGELALMALSSELGEPKAVACPTGRHLLWKGMRGDRPMLSVHLLLEPNGGSYPVRLLIGDPCRKEGDMLQAVTVSAAAEINGIIVDIHRRMVSV